MFAADRDHTVERVTLLGFTDPLDPARLEVGVEGRRLQDRAAQLQDPAEHVLVDVDAALRFGKALVAAQQADRLMPFGQ